MVNTQYRAWHVAEHAVSDRKPHADTLPSIQPAYYRGGAWRHNCPCGLGLIASGHYDEEADNTTYRLKIAPDPNTVAGTLTVAGYQPHTEPDWTTALAAINHQHTEENTVSTDIEPQQNAAPAPMTVPDKLEYARALAKSGLLPKDYRHQPQNVLFAVEYGQMLGLSTMAAITGVHVIDGKPTASAGLISGLVRAAGHKLRVTIDRQRMVARCVIIRTDDPDFEFVSEWDLDRAVKAGLCQRDKNGKAFQRDRNGKPGAWEKYTENMLKHRAVTECARDAAEDVLFGLHYTPEELGAVVDEDGEPVAVEATAERVTAAPADAAVQAEPVAEPSIDWDTAIAEAEGLGPEDAKTALTALWHTAAEQDRDNTALADQLRAACQRVADRLPEPATEA